MNPRCDCERCEGQHHHAFGGTYPCEGPVDCIQCHSPERQVNGRDDIETPERGGRFSMIETRRKKVVPVEVYGQDETP